MLKVNNGNSDLFKRFYAYSGNQITAEDTCLLSNTGSARRMVYATAGNVANHDGYDARLRLTHVSRPGQGTASAEFGAHGGTVGRRDFTYDGRGNRQSETDDCWDFTETYDSNSPDRLVSRDSVDAGSGCPASPHSSTTYTYDMDGRVASIVWPVDSSGLPARKVEFDPGASGGNGWDGVYREVSVNGHSYQYEYDALGRRRAKHYPSAGDFDEFYNAVTGEADDFKVKG